jgi:hypothetical protein
MASTSAFGWETPDDTDLVKDGAAAIRTLGNSIDTSMSELKGGTTGQVLSKTSNTDMDFTWVAQDDSNAIQNAIVDAKGDLIAATANDTPARLAVGANNTFLRPNSSAATGLEWAGGYTAYTPTISSFGGTAPTIGNGTINSSYLRIGNFVHYRIVITWGSTSTYGTGGTPWAFGLPFSSAVAAITGSAFILDAGIAWYYGWTPQGVTQGSGAFVSLTNAAGAAVTQGTPFTFGSGDQIHIQGVYEVVA